MLIINNINNYELVHKLISPPQHEGYFLSSCEFMNADLN